MMETLVLLPGMLGDARTFLPQIVDLSRDGPVLVAPLAGFDRIEEIASALLDRLPHRFALAGLSFGGIVALELMRRAPDRITRLCLMSTSPLAETPQQAAAREPRIVGARAGRFLDAIAEELPSAALAPGPLRAAVLAQVRDMALSFGPDEFVRQSRALQRRKDQQPTLRRIRQPVTVLCGVHDSLTPVRRHEFMAELIPYARLEILADAGHMLPLEQPEEVTHLLRDWMRQPMVLR